MIIITTTKEINKQFMRYTKLIYTNCGHKLSKAEEFKFENHIRTIAKEMNIFKIIKRAILKKSTHKKAERLLNGYK